MDDYPLMTPIGRILQTVRKNGYTMPASIEMEYEVPQGSNPVAALWRNTPPPRGAPPAVQTPSGDMPLT